jgi:hypothetical protein
MRLRWIESEHHGYKQHGQHPEDAGADEREPRWARLVNPAAPEPLRDIRQNLREHASFAGAGRHLASCGPGDLRRRGNLRDDHG